MLFEGVDEKIKNSIPFTVDEDVREWDYGQYEGLKTAEIVKLRKDKGLDPDSKWSIWRDGCEGGEQHFQVAERLDRFIKKINKIHEEAIEKVNLQISLLLHMVIF